MAQAVRLAPRWTSRTVAWLWLEWVERRYHVAGLGLPVPLPRADAAAAAGGPRGWACIAQRCISALNVPSTRAPAALGRIDAGSSGGRCRKPGGPSLPSRTR